MQSKEKEEIVFEITLGVLFGPFVGSGLIVLIKEILFWFIHFTQSLFIKKAEFEWFSYWRVDLNIKNDFSYQEWLYNLIKITNDNLQVLNNIANDFGGAFLTRTIFGSYFLYPIIIFMGILFLIAYIKDKF